MPDLEKYFTNREISWLHFNERVLQEASDPSVPLIERFKFLGIYSNNLDEFYRVRVATLRRISQLPKANKRHLDIDAKKILKEINALDTKLQERFTATYQALLQELEQLDIFMVNEKNLHEQHAWFIKKYFEEEVRPHLFPIMLNNLRSANSLQDKSVYLAIDLKSSSLNIKERFALIQVPTGRLSRFVILPSIDQKRFIILLDDVIRFCLDDIFSVYGYDQYEAYTIKFTRDAELDIDNDISRSFMETMSLSLKQRVENQPVRFIYDRSMPESLLGIVTKKFNITEHDSLAPRGRYHNFKDFMTFPNVGPKNLEYSSNPPLPHPQLPPHRSIISSIKKRDMMLHYPYQTFHYAIELIREASIDPKVRAIKMTLYRVARESNVIGALINAARNGKEVTVFLEVQARFDEEANIYWSERLQEEGVRIIQTIPGYKVHAKLLLIRRKEGDENVYYAYVGTGNFHEGTARVYADDALLTANPAIAADVNKVFHLLEEKFNRPSFDKLIVAPFHMRTFFLRQLNFEMVQARKGKEAWAIIKLNSLVDEEIVRKLYRASQAGVKIRLIIRGICVLQPGIPGISENIEAISIVDKYLEHSRVFIFHHGGEERIFISSADWMTRNFDHRIEVACPVEDPHIREELRTMLDIQWKDNCKARLLQPDALNMYRKVEEKESLRSQLAIYHYFRKRI
jgi:polyphosphate kinase